MQLITLNCRISTDMYCESRPLASRPHLRKVFNVIVFNHVYCELNNGALDLFLSSFIEIVFKL